MNEPRFGVQRYLSSSTSLAIAEELRSIDIPAYPERIDRYRFKVTVPFTPDVGHLDPPVVITTPRQYRQWIGEAQ